MEDIQRILSESGSRNAPEPDIVDQYTDDIGARDSSNVRRPVGFEEVQYNEQKSEKQSQVIPVAAGAASGTAGVAILGASDPVVVTALVGAGTATYVIGSRIGSIGTDRSDALTSDDFYLLDDDQVDPFDGDMQQDALEKLWQDSEIHGVSHYRTPGSSRLQALSSSAKERMGLTQPDKVTADPHHASREQLLATYRDIVKQADYQAILGVDTETFGDYTVELWTNWKDSVDLYQPFLAIAGEADDRTAYPAFGEYDDTQKLVNRTQASGEIDG